MNSKEMKKAVQAAIETLGIVWVSHHANRCDDAIEKLELVQAALSQQQSQPTVMDNLIVQPAQPSCEPKALAVFSETGNCIIWTSNREENIEEVSDRYGRPITKLYDSPPDYEALRTENRRLASKLHSQDEANYQSGCLLQESINKRDEELYFIKAERDALNVQIARIKSAISNDSTAISYQSIGQYRGYLLEQLK